MHIDIHLFSAFDSKYQIAKLMKSLVLRDCVCYPLMLWIATWCSSKFVTEPRHTANLSLTRVAPFPSNLIRCMRLPRRGGRPFGIIKMRMLFIFHFLRDLKTYTQTWNVLLPPFPNTDENVLLLCARNTF